MHRTSCYMGNTDSHVASLLGMTFLKMHRAQKMGGQGRPFRRHSHFQLSTLSQGVSAMSFLTHQNNDLLWLSSSLLDGQAVRPASPPVWAA